MNKTQTTLKKTFPLLGLIFSLSLAKGQTPFINTIVPRIADGTVDMVYPTANDCTIGDLSCLAVDYSSGPPLFVSAPAISSRFTGTNSVSAARGRAFETSSGYVNLGPAGLLTTGNLGVTVNANTRVTVKTQYTQMGRMGSTLFSRSYRVVLPTQTGRESQGIAQIWLKGELIGSGVRLGVTSASVMNTRTGESIDLTFNPEGGVVQLRSGSVGQTIANGDLVFRVDNLTGNNTRKGSIIGFLPVKTGDILGVVSNVASEYHSPVGTGLDASGFLNGDALSTSFIDFKIMTVLPKGGTSNTTLSLPVTGYTGP